MLGAAPSICFQPLAGRDRRGRGAEQAKRIGMAGTIKNVVDGARLDDPPGVHDSDPVGEFRDDGEIVGDPENRRAGLAAELLNLEQDLALDRDVERRRRLIGDDQVGLVQQRGRNRHPLAHAARELMRILLQARLG